MITSEHFGELLAAEQLDPRGEIRADMRMARIVTAIVNMAGKVADSPMQESEFLFPFGKPKEEEVEEDPDVILGAIATKARGR